MRELKLEEAQVFDFTTQRFDTGAATDADSTPTCEVFEDSTDTAIETPTVAKRASKTGNYRVTIAAAAANGYEVGKSYNVVASATVNSVAGKAVIGTFKVRARGKDDLAFPTTSGRSIDVAATGEVGLDFDNIKDATGAHTLTNITVPVVTTLTNAPSDPSGVTTLLSRLSATRAGYLDNLSGGAVALNADIVTILGRLTAARAGYLDNLNVGGSVASAASLTSVAGDVDSIVASIIDEISDPSALPAFPMSLAEAIAWTVYIAGKLATRTFDKSSLVEQILASDGVTVLAQATHMQAGDLTTKTAVAAP